MQNVQSQRSRGHAPRFQATAMSRSMRTRSKTALLYVLKYLGGFHVSRFLTRHALRVLCYHGTSTGDEHLFRRTLFIRTEFFRRRMEYLVRAGYPVLGLADAVDRLRNGNLPASSVVITVDDGWYGCLEGMFPVLREVGLEAHGEEHG